MHTHRATWRSAIPSALVFALIATAVSIGYRAQLAVALPGHSVDLRVLVVANGSRGSDASRDLIESTLQHLGAAYEVLDVTTTSLTPERLRTGGVGRFNGIIVTTNQLGAAFDAGEWSLLHDYQRDFAVGLAVMSGAPVAQGGVELGLRSGAAAGAGSPTTWTAVAAGRFPYYHTANGPPLGDAATTVVAAGSADPTVIPLLVRTDEQALLVELTYRDGRQVLFSSMTHRVSSRASQVLAYAFVDYATRGLHLGAPRMYLAAHVDDLFLATDMWAVGAGANGGEEFRISATDWRRAIAAQQSLTDRHPTAAGFRVEHAFNGAGAARSPGIDPLTDAVRASPGAFRYVSHTHTHRDLDARHGWSQSVIEDEVVANNAVWADLGLPGADTAAQGALVTGAHSGLSDGATPYPNGLNPVMVAALRRTGVRYLASDTSRTNQAEPGFVPGSNGDLVLVPRWPTSVFYNVNTPARMVDEYRALYAGSSTYAAIRAEEAQATFAHITSFANYPHFFHVANIHDYDGAGHSLLFDWLDDAISLYETFFTLPLVTEPFHRIGERTEARLVQAHAGVRARLAISTGVVTVWSDRPVTVEITGVNGPSYGPLRVRDVAVDGSSTFTVADYRPPSGYPLPPGVAEPANAPAPTPTPGSGPTPSPTPGADRPIAAVVRCAGLEATVIGTDADETLRGTAGDDVIVGSGGDDVIRGLGGNDVVCGGAGHDVIRGGGGADRLIGGNGRDRLIGGRGADDLVGGKGRDTLLGGRGNDDCRGGAGADAVRGCR